jgi:hypothetical protein
MDQSTKRSDRFSAILSTVLAVVILAAGVTAQQSRSNRSVSVAHLESDLRFQVESAFRLNPKQGNQRVRQLEAVLSAWRQAPKSAADRRLLADWLLEATTRSMPGSIQPLPAAPQFGKIETPPTPQPIEIVPEPVKNNNLVATAEVLDLSSEPKPEPFMATPAISHATIETTHEPLPSVTPTPAEPPFVEVSTRVASPAPQKVVVDPVVINLTELVARIAGYHRALDELEASLLVHERPQFERLSRQIRSLDGLINDFQFVKLYYESLTPVERRTISPPRAMESTLEELGRHLDRLQSEVAADFLGEFDTDMAKQLQHLRDQLDTIKHQVDW